MKCEICKKRDASLYRFVAAYNKQVPICASCYQNSLSFPKSGFPEAKSFLVDELAKALMGFQPVHEFYSEGDGAKSRVAVCPNCGFEFDEYYSKGRLGCVKCYDVFHARIKGAVYKIHGCVRHNGSRPS